MEVKPGYKKTEIGVIPEDWEVKTLGSLTTLLTNGFVGTATTAYVENDDGVLYIQGYNVLENGFNFHGIKHVSKAFHARNKKSCLQAGDLLTIQTGNIGVTTVVSPKLAGANCHALIISRFNKQGSDPGYYCQYFNSERGRVAFKAIETGTTMKHLNGGDMKRLFLPSPPIKEQTAIAAALSDVDSLIASLDKLITKKRAIKTATMQQLLTGKKRLLGFSGEWEVKRLGDILSVRHGKSQHEVASENGVFPILATGGEIGRTDAFLYDKPSVLIGRKGTIDRPQYIDSPFWTIDTLFYTEISKAADPRYVYYYFLTIDWRSYNEASGVPSLNASTIEAIEFHCPTTNEQTAIATVLSDMDAEITALEARRDKTRAIKQGMMQELLTGRTRLV